MKIKSAQKVHYDSGPNMTPLVDVVMVILIFLMMVGSFGGMEHYLLSNVPLINPNAPTQNVPDLDKIQVTVEISVENTANGFRAGVIGSSRAGVEAGSLDEVLQRLKAKYEQQGKTVDNMQVIIAPQANVRWMNLVTVYEAALRAKYTKIAFRGVS